MKKQLMLASIFALLTGITQAGVIAQSEIGDVRYIAQRLCCTNQQQDELPQSPDGLIPCGPFAACPVL